MIFACAMIFAARMGMIFAMRMKNEIACAMIFASQIHSH